MKDVITGQENNQNLSIKKLLLLFTGVAIGCVITILILKSSEPKDNRAQMSNKVLSHLAWYG